MAGRQKWNTWSPVFLRNGDRYGVYLTEEEAINADKENHYVYQWTNAVKTEVREFPMTVREFLQKLGTDGLRDGLHPNVWVNALFADYVAEPDKNIAAFLAAEGLPQSMNGGQKEYPNWIITDCRFSNEAQAVKDHGGIVVRVNRPRVEAVNAHPSETSLDDWKFGVVIEHDGTVEDLLAKVKTVLQEQSILV